MFNEIYGTYYFLMEQLLEKASRGSLSKSDIYAFVENHGFAESNLYFTPDALSQDGSGYNLLLQDENGYTSVLKNKPRRILTSNQKRFIKTILQDRRIRLFLNDVEMNKLQNELAGVEPLYDTVHIVLTETASDGDLFEDEDYRERFQVLKDAVKDNTLLKIVYDSSQGVRKTTIVAPFKLEYSIRDDKFRLCGVSINRRKPSKYVKLNIARMHQIIPLKAELSIDCESFISTKMLKEPITVEITDFRNGFERIFIALSNYKRVSSFNEETQKCMMKIYCLDDDVQDLLIQMLSFGPAVKIIGPKDFKQKYLERVKKQIEMLKAGV